MERQRYQPTQPEGKSQSQRVAERRHAVKALALEGLTPRETAKELNIPFGTIQNDLTIIRKGGVDIPKVSDATKRRKKVKELWEQNETANQISNQLSINPNTIYADISRLRESGEDISYRIKPLESNASKRRKHVRELWDDGYTSKGIAEELKEKHHVIYNDITKGRKQGNQIAYRAIKPLQSEVRDRRKKVKELSEEGMQPKQIAEKLGADRAVIRRDLYLQRKAEKNT